MFGIKNYNILPLSDKQTALLGIHPSGFSDQQRAELQRELSAIQTQIRNTRNQARTLL